MGTITAKITSLTIAYSIVYSGADQRKIQSSASLAFVRGNHRLPANNAEMFPFDDVITILCTLVEPLSLGDDISTLYVESD